MDFSDARGEQCYFCLVSLLQGLSLALGKRCGRPLSPNLTTEANRRTNTTGWLSKMDSHGFAGPRKIMTECCKVVSSGQLLTPAIIHWACQGLAALTAGSGRGGAGRAFPAAARQGGAAQRTGSPHPTNSCWAARSCEKGKWKSRSLFHPCSYYTNTSKEGRGFQSLHPSQRNSDQKPLLGWLFSEEARGKEFKQYDWLPGVYISIARDWQPLSDNKEMGDVKVTGSTASAVSHWTARLGWACNLQPLLQVENKSKEKVWADLSPGTARWHLAVHPQTDVTNSEKLLKNTFCASFIWLQ